MLKMSEIVEWDSKAIGSKISELRTELFNMRMEKAVSGLEKPHRIKVIKKDIARLLTVQNSKGE